MDEKSYAAKSILAIGTGILAVVMGIVVFVLAAGNQGSDNSFANQLALIFLIAGIAMIIWGIYLRKTYVTKKEDMKEGKKLAARAILIFLAIFIPVFILVMSFAMNQNDDRAGTCKSCGRSWNAGDSNGNYRNIAQTGMCNNCENNYHDMKDLVGE